MTTIYKNAEATVLSWKREKSTSMGNPVFSFVLAIGDDVIKGKTRPNSMFVYGLQNSPETLVNVKIEVTPSGRVYLDNATTK